MSRSSEGPQQPEALADILEAVTGVLGIGQKLAECRAQTAWPVAVGSTLAQHSRALRVRNGTLEVAVPAAVWRNQLMFMQREIVARLNEHAGAPVIENLVLVNRQ